MNDELKRIECLHCGKGFDIMEQPFGEGILCPYCGAEID